MFAQLATLVCLPACSISEKELGHATPIYPPDIGSGSHRFLCAGLIEQICAGSYGSKPRLSVIDYHRSSTDIPRAIVTRSRHESNAGRWMDKSSPDLRKVFAPTPDPPEENLQPTV